MHVIPEATPGNVVDPSGRYKCPLCKVQGTGDEADTGWVSCPMVGARMICLGSCIDHQKVARSENFADHPEWELFSSIGDAANISAEDARRQCLTHQLEVIDDQLERGSEDEPELRALRSVVESRLAEV